MSRFLLALVFGVAVTTATACYGTGTYVVDDYGTYYDSTPYYTAGVYSTYPYGYYPYYSGYYPYYRSYYRPYYPYYRGSYGHRHYYGTPYRDHRTYGHGYHRSGYHGGGHHGGAVHSTRGAPGGVHVSPPPTRGGRG
jgi:hypothetical protein